MSDRQSQTGILEHVHMRAPKQYEVIMHNDDITTMEFVVHVLRTVFFKSADEATNLMLDVHEKGAAVVGVYTFDTAVSKAHKATMMAGEEGFPLRLTVNPIE